MARVRFEDLDKYNSSGSYKQAPPRFKLPDDGDTAQVRFLLEDQEDLNQCYVNTHKIKLGKNAKFPNWNVSCLRENYNDSVKDCPFCEAGISSSVKVFLPLYNLDTDRFEFWERSKAYIPKMTKRMTKYQDFPSHIFEIEREGAEGDKSTTYTISEVDEDDVTLEELLEQLGIGEIPDVIESGFVLEKTKEEMEVYLETGNFPRSGGSEDDDKSVRRRESTKSKKYDEEDDEEPPFEEDDDEEEVKPRRRSTGRTVSANDRSGRRRRRERDPEDDF